MDIISLLEEDSMERMILELRFIDCKYWKEIGKEMHLSKRACFQYQNRALEKLIESGKVKKYLKNKSVHLYAPPCTSICAIMVSSKEK